MDEIDDEKEKALECQDKRRVGAYARISPPIRYLLISVVEKKRRNRRREEIWWGRRNEMENRGDEERNNLFLSFSSKVNHIELR